MKRIHTLLLTPCILFLMNGCMKDYFCHGPEYTGDIPVTSTSMEFLPTVDSTAFVNSYNTMVYTSMGLQEQVDTIMVESYCSDVFGTANIYAQTISYCHNYEDPVTGKVIQYSLRPMSYAGSVCNGVAVHAIVDLLDVQFINKYTPHKPSVYSCTLITDTRGDSLPDYLYNSIHYERLHFGNRLYEDVYSESDTNCYFNESSENPYPHRTVFRKGKGIIAIQFSEMDFWYAVE
jgi:hypothetical protein